MYFNTIKTKIEYLIRELNQKRGQVKVIGEMRPPQLSFTVSPTGEALRSPAVHTHSAQPHTASPPWADTLNPPHRCVFGWGSIAQFVHVRSPTSVSRLCTVPHGEASPQQGGRPWGMHPGQQTPLAYSPLQTSPSFPLYTPSWIASSSSVHHRGRCLQVNS